MPFTKYVHKEFIVLTSKIFDIVIKKFSSLDGDVFPDPFSYLKFFFGGFFFNMFTSMHIFLKNKMAFNTTSGDLFSKFET